MKKAAAILLAITMLFLVGCDNGRPETTPEPSPVAVSSGDCYEVSLLKNNDGIEKYSYTVKTHDGKVIESAICAKQAQGQALERRPFGHTLLHRFRQLRALLRH